MVVVEIIVLVVGVGLFVKRMVICFIECDFFFGLDKGEDMIGYFLRFF